MSRTRAARRPRAALILVTVLAVALAGLPSAAALPVEAPRLTNLDHLDFLTDRVDPPEQDGHTTYREQDEPALGFLWTYAEPVGDGTYRRLGGGDYDPETDTWGQGAFNADDVSRAAVVYLRHFAQFGDESSREQAYELLRGLAYLQTATGENRGNVVLWMQPDGTLSPVVEGDLEGLPSDSDVTYWLNRTIWAFGEGYEVFAGVDPAFAAFLAERLDLAVDALDRQLLGPDYGTFQTVDGLEWPAWMIQDGADASSEAVYGLSAYVRSGGGAAARRALEQLSEGIALMQLGDADTWPFGALMPWTQSRSVYHSWAAQMAGALATAGTVLGDDALIGSAVGEVGRLTPHMLAQGGPDHEWLPAPVNKVQIAYSADAQLQGLLRTGEAAGREGFTDLAGIAAAWYFGNNPAEVPMYDPATGRTFDGIEQDAPAGEPQRVNVNSGAESTIHGLLSMLALDAHPDVAAAARIATRVDHVTYAYVEAESGALAGDAEVVVPASQWTGESQWSGNAYVELRQGGSVTIDVDLPVTDRYLLYPVLDRQQLDPGQAVTSHTLGEVFAGLVDHGGAGAAGITPTAGYLDVADTRTVDVVGAGPTTTVATNVHPYGRGRPARLDSVLVQPEVEWLVLAGEDGEGQALLRSFALDVQTRTVTLPGMDSGVARAYDTGGRLVTTTPLDGEEVTVPVEPGGFTIVGTDAGEPAAPASVLPVAGADRVGTAVAVSRQTHDRAGTVVLARADVYADALAGAPLAAALGAPLLLTGGGRLDQAVVAEIDRLGARRAVLLGGTAALGAGVAGDLTAAGLDVDRLAGVNRFATAALVAAEMGAAGMSAAGMGGGEVVLAEGASSDPARGWPDALSASALAASTGRPLLLVERDRLPDETAAALSAGTDVTIVGGPAAVGAAVAAAVDARAGQVARIAGATRYDTSAAVADETLRRGADAATVWVATGRDWPDGLVAGAAAATDGGVFLLVDGRGLAGSPASAAWLAGHATEVDAVRVAGGDAAVGEDAIAALAEAVGAG